MKTTYQKPSTEMIFLNVQQIVCASPTGTPTVSGKTSDETILLSREMPSFNAWGDDDDEE